MLKLDLHVHTVLSDGDRIDRIIAVAEGRRLDGIAITDQYNSLYPFFPLSVTLSKRIAGKLNLPQTGGSDAHKYSQVGKCYTLVNSEKNIEEIMEKIRGGLIESSGRPAEIGIRTKISINFLTTFIPKIIDLNRNHHLLANKILEYEQ